ncbi:MAG TPA: thioredoxin domain-containing protein [Pyrinomonadaceae bacterium]|nr:thioredoxin domain-containing protein [Pyrinomonadaceae bacterium]
MKRVLPIVIILVALAVALGAAWYLKQNATRSTAPVANGPVAPVPAGKPAPTVVEPGAQPPHAIGVAGAPVTLEEFGDFECPPCGRLHPELKQIEHEYGQRVRIIFRELPLVPTHAHALAAARNAEAAGLQGKFWEMHDLLYENQKTWHAAFDVRPIFEGYATRIGLDLERFKRDLGSEMVERRIFLDGKRAHSLGVESTPTVFLNGRELSFESLALDKLRGQIDAELAKAAK